MSEERGQKLLSAVERLVADTEKLLAIVAEHQERVDAGRHEDEAAYRKAVAGELISTFSNRTALSGGAAALPAVIPGLGSVVTLVGGTLADMALMLKFEVELALCLTALYGYDIHQDRERQLAFLLAGVKTYEEREQRHVVLDAAIAEGTAIWNYSGREITKGVTSVFTKIALIGVSRGFLRVLPVVGVAVGAGMNKALTRRVGKRCQEELARRVQFEDVKVANR
ncbi:MAG: EcsC family protein [Deltaproteobacteria bacterium]|nr:EcsC family protein [Deltaproteobacteria bacterium]